MRPFKFRIRLELSPEDRLNSDAELSECDLGSVVGNIQFTGRSEDKRISSATQIIVRSKDGFASEPQARTAAGIVTNALLIGAAREHLGIDFGEEGPRGWITDYGRKWLAQRAGFTGEVLNDQPGAMVYKDSGNTRFATLNPGRAIIGRPLDRFLTGVQKSVAKAQNLLPRHILALELYSASKFERSQRARFLTLITIIEILSDRQSRSKQGLAVINSISQLVSSADLPGSEREQLLRGLGYLKAESIAAACRRLVAEQLGSDAEVKFKKWYTARSELVHTGKATLDLGLVITEIDQTVVRLLLAACGVNN